MSALEGSGRSDDAPDAESQDRTVRILLSLVDDLTVEQEEEGLLRTTLEHVVQTLDLLGGVTFLLADEEGALRAAAEDGAATDHWDDALHVSREALDGEPRVRSLGEDWVAATPLVARVRTLGVLALVGRRDRAAPPREHLLVALGKQIGTGLENVRTYGELRASSTRAAVVHRIMAALSTSLELRTVVPPFAQELSTIESFDRLAIGFVNDSGDYIQTAGHPEDACWGFGAVLPVVGSGPGSVVLNNRPVLQRDLLHNHRYIEDMKLLDDGIRSYVILPLNARGRSIGVLALGSVASGAYDEATLARVQPIADSVSLALENVRLFQKTRELSITDEVTPLYNFRFFHQILERELTLVDRYKSVLSLIFIDLDRFKPINDTYGHLRGSRVLREVGFLMREAVRETDYPARYGGDEFVVILPQTDGRTARSLAEKLRRMVEDHVFLQEEGINARIGVSLGVATYPADARTKEALVRLADERMYQEKQDRTRESER